MTLCPSVKVKVKSLSHVRLFATPWTVAYHAPPSTGFFRQEHWSGLPFPSPGDLPSPGIESGSPALQADALLSEPPAPFHDVPQIPGWAGLWRAFWTRPGSTANRPACGVKPHYVPSGPMCVTVYGGAEGWMSSPQSHSPPRPVPWSTALSQPGRGSQRGPCLPVTWRPGLPETWMGSAGSSPYPG